MKRVVFFLCGTLITLSVSAQVAPTGVVQTTRPATTNPQLTLDTLKTTDVYEKVHIPLKEPIPYVQLREADIMWSKDVWRMIDLREKMNQPLYFPTTPISNRMNFIDLVLHGIREHNLHAFSDNPEKLFSTETMMSFDDIVKKLDYDSIASAALNKPIFKTTTIKRLLIKEKWFFDKQHSTMQVRIVGICPVKVYPRLNDDGTPSSDILYNFTFWIYFPEYRDLFTKYEVFNQFNNSQNISFDDLFMQRRFASFIYAESNVYDNRKIVDYSTGDDALYEGEKIKQSLFEIEHDLWEW